MFFLKIIRCKNNFFIHTPKLLKIYTILRLFKIYFMLFRLNCHNSIFINPNFKNSFQKKKKNKNIFYLFLFFFIHIRIIYSFIIFTFAGQIIQNYYCALIHKEKECFMYIYEIQFSFQIYNYVLSIVYKMFTILNFTISIFIILSTHFMQ